MKTQDYLKALNANMKRMGRGYRLYAIDGEPLTPPKEWRTKSEMDADLKDWYENGWQERAK